MLVEVVEDYLRVKALERSKEKPNPFRASSLGRCTRESCFDLLGLPGKPLQPRRMMTFEHGNLIHDYLADLFKRALGWKFVDGLDFQDNFFELDGVKISYHLDGAYQHYCEVCKKDEIAIVEFKGLANRGFDMARRGEIDHTYLCQAWGYQQGTSFNPIIMVPFRKETAHFATIVFDRHAPEKIVTQRLTGDPIALATEDPLLVTEIRTPFDPSVEKYVRERIKWLTLYDKLQRNDALGDLPMRVTHYVPGVEAVEDEVVKVQGGGKALMRQAELMADGVMAARDMSSKGSWYTIPTGRKILGFPCSYCAHMDRCFPTAKMEMDKDRSIWIVP